MKTWLPGLGLLLIACMIAVPGASADINTTDPSHYLTHGEHLAGQRDMSKYSQPFRVEPVRAMNESTARHDPNVTACGSDGWMISKSCRSPFTRYETSFTHQIVYNVNATRPGLPGPVVVYGRSWGLLEDPGYVVPGEKPDIFLRAALTPDLNAVFVDRCKFDKIPCPAVGGGSHG